MKIRDIIRSGRLEQTDSKILAGGFYLLQPERYR